MQIKCGSRTNLWHTAESPDSQRRVNLRPISIRHAEHVQGTKGTWAALALQGRERSGQQHGAATRTGPQPCAKKRLTTREAADPEGWPARTSRRDPAVRP